jgi:hypothetical protein
MEQIKQQQLGADKPSTSAREVSDARHTKKERAKEAPSNAKNAPPATSTGQTGLTGGPDGDRQVEQPGDGVG